MPEYFTDWVQLDGFTVRERMRVRTAITDPTTLIHPEHIGPIEMPVYIEDVRDPGYDQVPTSSQVRADQQAATIEAKKWLTTLNSGPGEPSYDTSMRVAGSASHLHDYDPLPWEVDTRVDLINAFEAANPDVAVLEVQWETNPFAVQPWGASTDRVIEMTDSLISHQHFDVDGNLTHSSGSFEEIVAVAVPWDSSSDGGEFDTATVPTDSWQASTLESASLGLSVVDARAYDIIGTATAFRTALTDSWWNANSWPVSSNLVTEYNTRGVPLVLGADWALTPNGTDGIGFEVHEFIATAATVWFESFWTPPRYRIRYSSNHNPSIVRQYPVDRLGWGASGARIYPPRKTDRIVGGHH